MIISGGHNGHTGLGHFNSGILTGQILGLKYQQVDSWDMAKRNGHTG